MAEEEPGASAGEEQEEEEAPAAAAAGVDPKQDDVKPVIFIGLFIATLFSMGRSFKIFPFQFHSCRGAWVVAKPRGEWLCHDLHVWISPVCSNQDGRKGNRTMTLTLKVPWHVFPGDSTISKVWVVCLWRRRRETPGKVVLKASYVTQICIRLPRLKSEKFSGIPVLFIPGNSGSHKQVSLII